jgi:ATP-dependent DNA helicase RecG
MSARIDELNFLLKGHENEHLEFKEAKNHYDFEELVKYCAALANEGGGKMILGASDKPPRKVVGSLAFSDLERTKAGLIERLRLRVSAEAIAHPDGRVIVFDIPSRPLGFPIQYKGAYWMRAGGTLAPMPPEQLMRIFDETGPDFSAELCPKASLRDLDPAAIESLRSLWMRKSGNVVLQQLTPEQLLRDCELIVEGGITYASLILLGTREALGRHLAQAEVVFEYRSSEASGPAQQRKEYRQGFFSFRDDVWNTVNLRNDVQHFQDGLFVWDIRTFNEAVVREVILNAVSHRDYRLAGSVFVRQFPRKMEIVSPGGFLPGITPENVLWNQAPRNRRIAEVAGKCGLVERAGQGMNRMFEECIKESKPRPDFSRTDEYHVWVTLHGEIGDPQFLRFLEKVGKERLASFTTQDLLVLDLIHSEEPVEPNLRAALNILVERGIVERIGRGRGVRHLLSRDLYSFVGKKGVYTRKRGLDRETNKELLLKHIQDNNKEGSNLGELMQVLPFLSRNQVQKLVQELKQGGRVHKLGRTKGGRWFLGPSST